MCVQSLKEISDVCPFFVLISHGMTQGHLKMFLALILLFLQDSFCWEPKFIVPDLHAVSGRQVSMYHLHAGQIFHPFGDLYREVQQHLLNIILNSVP